MKLTYDTDSILFGLLKNDPAIVAAISGAIYVGHRPLNSEKEDIVINTIALSQDYLPQLGTSNINIHVPDMTVKISGVDQQVENRNRLKTISQIVLSSLRDANIQGLKYLVESQTILNEPEIRQHYSNIRISWNIHE